MSSLEISELTEKEHFHVMRDIKGFIEDGGIDERKTALISYLDTQNREQPMYMLDFVGTMTLVTGYDVNRRRKVISRWVALEKGEAEPAFKEASIEDLTTEMKHAPLDDQG
jgi:phage regulator Rha-like protein